MFLANVARAYTPPIMHFATTSTTMKHPTPTIWLYQMDYSGCSAHADRWHVASEVRQGGQRWPAIMGVCLTM